MSQVVKDALMSSSDDSCTMPTSPHDLLVSTKDNVHSNLAPEVLHKMALRSGEGCMESSTGALIAFSGEKTGRSPKDKRVVVNAESESNIWWGKESPNKPLTPESFDRNREIALSYINGCTDVFVQDGFINWENKTRIKVRVICTRAYHALFMHNMMIRPTEEELQSFGEPDFTIYNAGACSADKTVPGVTSNTSVAINVDEGEMVILGTEYAGEMKKGVFSVMHYLMPLRGHLTLHSGCNMGEMKDVSLFFGLSGTGKTTLSADPRRPLIGDDEHTWTQDGISNLEGGCYAKCINLSEEREPDIFHAIRRGAVLENIVADPETGVVDYDDTSITENTRASYPVEHIANAKIPCVGPHPKNVILLCCDAFGVLPPVAKLSRAQTMYHFVSGYTAKVAGTEVGVTEPSATFSPCFGGAFLMWHPMQYANMLAEKMEEHDAAAWFINTGWTGGPYGVGQRMSLKHTRAIIDAIHSGELESPDAEYDTMPVFGLKVPTSISGVPDEVLRPWAAWSDRQAYDAAMMDLAGRFDKNIQQYMGSSLVSERLAEEIRFGGPNVPQKAPEKAKNSSKFPEPVPAPAPTACAVVAGAAALNQLKHGKAW